MAQLSKKRLLAYLALFGNVLVWGAALAIVKRGFQDDLNPYLFLLARFTFATILGLPVVFLIKNKPKVNKVFQPRNVLKIGLLELIGSVTGLLLLYIGLEKTSAIEANLISATWPIFLTIGGVVFLREREQRHEFMGLLLAIIGTFLLVGRPMLEGQINGHLTGNLLILLYSLVNAAYLLVAKRLYSNFHKWAITFISFCVSFVSLFFITSYLNLSPISFLTHDLWQLGFWPLAAIFYMATFGSIIGLSLYLIGQDLIEASEASLFSYLNPLIGIPTSILLLRESVSPIDIVALVVILIGVYIAEKR